MCKLKKIIVLQTKKTGFLIDHDNKPIIHIVAINKNFWEKASWHKMWVRATYEEKETQAQGQSLCIISFLDQRNVSHSSERAEVGKRAELYED